MPIRFHKIGIAENVATRMEAVQIHNPLLVTLIRKIPWPSRLMALLIERTTHKVLAPYRVRGEWFDADWATIKQVLLPIAAAGRVIRWRHMSERRQLREEWEHENPHWREAGEDNMRIDARIMGKPLPDPPPP